MTLIRTRLKWLMQHRLALFLALLAIESLFFVTNGLNSMLRQPTDGWELVILPYDDQITPNGYWLIPYFVGFAFAALIPLWAAFFMQIRSTGSLLPGSPALASTLCICSFRRMSPARAGDGPRRRCLREILRNSYKLGRRGQHHMPRPAARISTR